MNNPIISQFHAAARLVNEWRDTISYNAGAALVIYEVAKTGHFVIPVAAALTTVFVRESIRGYKWSRSREKQIAGYQAAKIDSEKFSCAACCVANAGGGVGVAALALVGGTPLCIPMATLALLASAALCLSAGGPRGVANAYKTMWDWPRKRGDGGTTQTQKLKNGFERLVLGTFGRLQPIPVRPRPTYVPERDRHHMLVVA